MKYLTVLKVLLNENSHLKNKLLSRHFKCMLYRTFFQYNRPTGHTHATTQKIRPATLILFVMVQMPVERTADT